MTMTKSQAWFEKNINEDEEALIAIGELSNRAISDKFALTLTTPELPIAMYSVIFRSIKDVLKSKEEENSDYSIEIANRVKIGYSNYDNENAEKNGNFMVFIKHIPGSKVENTRDEEEETNKTIELAAQWNAINITTDIEVIQEIADKAKKNIDDELNTAIGSTELVIPLFITIHESMISYLSLKRVELQECEYEINMAGEFFVGVRENDEGEEEVYFIPPVDLRLAMKDDDAANKKAK